jgi:hypothetical protein
MDRKASLNRYYVLALVAVLVVSKVIVYRLNPPG